MEEMLSGFVSKYPTIMMILSMVGTLALAAQGIVFLTPTKKDDEFVEGLLKKNLVKKLFDFLVKLAPFGKK